MKTASTAKTKRAKNAAVAKVWESIFEVIDSQMQRVWLRRYTFLENESEDLVSEVVTRVPQFIERYDPDRGTPPKQFWYHTIYRAFQDALRRRDPLGISYPQRKHYPKPVAISEISSAMVESGRNNMNKGYVANYDEA